MSRATHRDPTADKAIGRATRMAQTKHRFGCVVDGGPHRNGVRGWWCVKCGANPDAHLLDLLLELDARAGGRW